MEDTNVKLTDIINDLIESNEKNYSDDNGVYQHGATKRFAHGTQEVYSL